MSGLSCFEILKTRDGSQNQIAWCDFCVEGSFAVATLSCCPLPICLEMLRQVVETWLLWCLAGLLVTKVLRILLCQKLFWKVFKEFSLLFFNCKRKIHSLQLHYHFLWKNISRAVNEQAITKQKTSVIFLSLPGSISIAKPYLAFLHFGAHHRFEPAAHQ